MSASPRWQSAYRETDPALRQLRRVFEIDAAFLLKSRGLIATLPKDERLKPEQPNAFAIVRRDSILCDRYRRVLGAADSTFDIEAAAELIVHSLQQRQLAARVASLLSSAQVASFPRGRAVAEALRSRRQASLRNVLNTLAPPGKRRRKKPLAKLRDMTLTEREARQVLAGKLGDGVVAPAPSRGRPEGQKELLAALRAIPLTQREARQVLCLAGLWLPRKPS